MHPFIPYAQTEACEDRILASWQVLFAKIRLPITQHVRTLPTWMETISGAPLLPIFSRASFRHTKETKKQSLQPKIMCQ